MEVNIMTHIYIITKEGRRYSDAGLDYVTNAVKSNYGVTDELAFHMGYEYNVAKNLIMGLDLHSDGYIVISTEDGISFASNKNPAVKKVLEEHPNDSSWESLVKYLVNKEE
jgi:hypothetical protein